MQKQIQIPLQADREIPASPSAVTTENSGRKTLDQRRASDAWQKVEAISKGDEKLWQDYTGEAHKLPVRIMASGLGQALAFLHAKRKKKPGLMTLLLDLSTWALVERIKDSHIKPPEQQSPDLLRAVIDSDTEFLRWATDETLAYLQWINRFAEGLGFEPGVSTEG